MKIIKRHLSLFLSAMMMISAVTCTSSSAVSPSEENLAGKSVNLGMDHLSSIYGPEYASNSIDPSQVSKLNNIVVLIRFDGEKEFATSARTNTLNSVYNDSETSLKNYLYEHSYGDLTVNSDFFPKTADGSTIISYVDPNPSGYYKTESSTNTIGYTNNTERFAREKELVENAINGTKAQIEKAFSGEDIDQNNDWLVDSLTFIVNTTPNPINGIEWNDLLWPHQYGYYSYGLQINGRYVRDYNLVCAEGTSYGIMANDPDYGYSGIITHEFLHTISLPDLYHYSEPGNPIGIWDIMGYTFYESPQNLTQYYQRDYLGWGDAIDEITETGTYSVTYPKFNSVAEDGGETGGHETAYKIRSPYSDDEYFIVEFRKKVDYDINIPESGLLVYRINDTVGGADGNADGPPDKLFVFRPDMTDANPTSYGDDAVLSKESGRTSIGVEYSETDNGFVTDSLCFSDGSNSGIVIESVGSAAGDSISFKVILPNDPDEGGDTEVPDEPQIPVVPERTFDKLQIVTCADSNRCSFVATVSNFTVEDSFSFYVLKDGNLVYSAKNVYSNTVSFAASNAGRYTVVAYCGHDADMVSKSLSFDVSVS